MGDYDGLSRVEVGTVGSKASKNEQDRTVANLISLAIAN